MKAPPLTSCASTGHVIDTGCLWTREIRVSQADALTDQTARQILGHNQARAEMCAAVDERINELAIRWGEICELQR